MKAEEKTNVMRVLEQKKVPYKGHCYVDTDAVSGVEVAEVLGRKPEKIEVYLSEAELRVCDSGSQGTGSEEGGKGGRREVHRDGKIEGSSAADRLYPWWLFPCRHEEIFQDHH